MNIFKKIVETIRREIPQIHICTLWSPEKLGSHLILPKLYDFSNLDFPWNLCYSLPFGVRDPCKVEIPKICHPKRKFQLPTINSQTRLPLVSGRVKNPDFFNLDTIFQMHHFSTLKNYPTKNAACLMHPQEWVPCKDVQFSTLRITSSRVRQVCPAEQTRIALGDIMRHVGMSRKLLILHRFQSYCCWNPVWKPVEVGWLSHHLHGFMTIPGGFRHFSSKLSNLCQSYPKEKKGTDFGHQGSCRSETQWRIFFSSADVSKNHPLKISQKVRCLVFFFGNADMFLWISEMGLHFSPIS